MIRLFPLFWQVVQAAAFLTPPGPPLPKPAAAMARRKAPKHKDIISEEEDEEGSEGNDAESHEEADDPDGEAKSDQEETEDQSRPAKRTFGLAQCDLCYKTFVKQSTNHKYCTSVEC